MTSKLKAITQSISELSESQITELYCLYKKYYTNNNRDTFYQDLSEKDHVFIMLDKQSGCIKGFSTVKTISLVLASGKEIYGVYSGDTIIDKNYWGQSALQVQFIKYFLRFKASHPFSDVYWFLISKGYKTYLLMANNFTQYYPRHDLATPEKMTVIIDTFARKLFPDNWSQQDGLIQFSLKHDHLKNNIAPITEKLRKIEKIAYFERMNPSWHEGSELACIARIDLSSPLRYICKALKKGCFKILKGNKNKFETTKRSEKK